MVSPHCYRRLCLRTGTTPCIETLLLLYAVPLRDPAYRHAEGNSAAHVKASMMGFSAVVPVLAGRLVLGTWQGIYLCEFDGPRRRQALVTVLPA